MAHTASSTVTPAHSDKVVYLKHILSFYIFTGYVGRNGFSGFFYHIVIGDGIAHFEPSTDLGDVGRQITTLPVCALHGAL
jgi:hypothetical protein